jgi:CRISPR-associated protein Csy2
MNTVFTDKPEHWALLVVPRVRVQNANAISSPMTWGFPAITAAVGA